MPPAALTLKTSLARVPEAMSLNFCRSIRGKEDETMNCEGVADGAETAEVCGASLQYDSN